MVGRENDTERETEKEGVSSLGASQGSLAAWQATGIIMQFLQEIRDENPVFHELAFDRETQGTVNLGQRILDVRLSTFKLN